MDAEEDGSGDLLPVSVAVSVAVDVAAGALDEVTVEVAGTEDVVRLMIVAGAAVDEDAAEVVADDDAVSEVAADEDVAVAGADEVVRTMVEGGAVPVLAEADELTVAELDTVPVAVSLAEVLLSVRVAEVLDAVLVAVSLALLEVAVVVTELLVVAAVAVAVADEEIDVWVVELEVVVPVWPTGSSLTVHLVTFSNTSSPAAFFLGVRVTSQVSVTLPAALFGVWSISKAEHGRSIVWTHVSDVVVVVTVLDPSA